MRGVLLHATLNFGFVYVPVGIHATASRKDIKFRTICTECDQPIHQYNRCDQCDKSHPETTKGWEIAKGAFIPIDADELSAYAVGREKLIQLRKFVPKEEIHPLMVERSYYLGINEKLHQPYEILSRAMIDSEVVGIGKASLWGKEYPVSVNAEAGVLHLNMLFCADELIPNGELIAAIDLDVAAEELSLAQQFIEMKRGQLDLMTDLVSVSREKTTGFLSAKASGAKLEMSVAEPEPVVTLSALDALKKSVMV